MTSRHSAAAAAEPRPWAKHPAEHRHSRTGRRARTSTTRTVVSRVGGVVAWIVATVMIALIVLLVVVPRVIGGEPYTILTGSMTPLMPPGTVVVTRPVPFDSIMVGDVVTYQIESGLPAVVTHRVAGVDLGEDGRFLRTKGDANSAEDQNPVREAQVRGAVWYWIPAVGYLTAIGTGGGREQLAQAIGVVLIGYALWMLIAALRKRAASRKLVDDPTETPHEPQQLPTEQTQTSSTTPPSQHQNSA